MGFVGQISAKQAESVAKQQQIAEIEGWISQLEAAIVNGAREVAIETKKLKKRKPAPRRKRLRKQSPSSTHPNSGLPRAKVSSQLLRPN